MPDEYAAVDAPGHVFTLDDGHDDKHERRLFPQLDHQHQPVDDYDVLVVHERSIRQANTPADYAHGSTHPQSDRVVRIVVQNDHQLVHYQYVQFALFDLFVHIVQ